MALVNYESSEEEDNSPAAVLSPPADVASTQHACQDLLTDQAQKVLPSIHMENNGAKQEPQSNGQRPPSPKPIEHPPANKEGPVIGPMIPPDAPVSDLSEEDEEPRPMPQSPYSANQALLRDLTLPTIPNYDIPPSPPGSPSESSNAKFKHFLQLKKQGVHFNEKLSKSPALRNPSLMQKLMDFADIDEAEQYSTTLPTELWNPTNFPHYAFKGELYKSQQEITKAKEEEKLRGHRESVDFVPATAPDPGSRNGTPGVGYRGGQKSAAERVMAGLDRGRSNSPLVQGLKRKSRFES